MGNQVDQLDVYQSGGLVRIRGFTTTPRIGYSIIQTAGYARTRAFGTAGAGAVYSINPVGHTRTRVVNGNTLVVWTSSTYVQDAPAGEVFSVRDFGDSTKSVMKATTAGAITAKTIVVKQKVSTDVALTIQPDVSSTPSAMRLLNSSGDLMLYITSAGSVIMSAIIGASGAAPGLNIRSQGDSYNLTLGLNHTYSDRGYVALRDDSHNAMYLEFWANANTPVLALTDGAGPPAGAGLHLITVGATPAAPASDYIIFVDTDGVMKAINSGGVLYTLLDTKSFTIRKPSDESVNNSTTLQDDDAFQFSIGASEVVEFELTAMIVPNTATMDFKCAWSLPASANVYWAAQGFFGNPPTALGNNTTITVDLPGTARYPLSLRGWIEGGGTAGTCKWQWAQNVLENSSPGVTVKKGSLLRGERG